MISHGLTPFLLAGLGLWACVGAERVLAQSEPTHWVAAFSQLQPAPLDLRDTKVPLEQRIALADALGEHGPAGAAIASLKDALEADPPPPGRLREAIALALARRLGASAELPEPLARVLAAAAKRAPARSTSKLGVAWLDRPRSGAEMVRAFLQEGDPVTLRAMVHKLAELKLHGLAAPADPDVLAQALCDRQTAPHALLMLAAEAKGQPSETTRRALRAALAGAPCASDAPVVLDDDPEAVPSRILGALGLAAIDDGAAVPVLRRALRSPFAPVRLAATVALSAIATAPACAALASHARIENNARVRHALRCSVRSRD